MSDLLLQGKNAVITGAAGGIGRSICEVFAKHGCNIWACIHTVHADSDAFFEHLRAQYGVWIKTICIELTNSDSIAAGMSEILGDKLPIDILVNNAGIADTALLAETSVDKIRLVYEVNFFSTLAIIQKLSRRMIRNKRGNIINMASVTGFENQPGRLAYGGSKASMIYMTRTLANELKPLGIRVNAIAPGPVDTEMTTHRDAQLLERFRAETYDHRLATTEEIANVALFLASDLSAHIDGQTIRIDGGR